MRQRLDTYLVTEGLVLTRSQAEGYIRMGKVQVNGRTITKAGHMVGDVDRVKLIVTDQYVSRAALKLESVARILNLYFTGKTMLDVGSSTGGFTDYALKHGAVKVIAVDVGTDQLHPHLRNDSRIELHEKTDIRDMKALSSAADLVVIDVSFISLREILPAVARLVHPKTVIVAMVKPQFEAAQSRQKHKGVIKNDAMRRKILQDFEQWVRGHFVIIDKADSRVAGSKGNVERFYRLQRTA